MKTIKELISEFRSWIRKLMSSIFDDQTADPTIEHGQDNEQ